ncbi:MAG: hypothetical protein ACLP9Y_10385 [Mycobacterium sp.]
MGLPAAAGRRRGRRLAVSAGGLYDKRYWHMQIDGHPGYSFAEHLAAAGFIVIALDHLGVGESTDPTASGQLGLKLLATGDAEVARRSVKACAMATSSATFRRWPPP